MTVELACPLTPSTEPHARDLWRALSRSEREAPMSRIAATAALLSLTLAACGGGDNAGETEGKATTAETTHCDYNAPPPYTKARDITAAGGATCDEAVTIVKLGRGSESGRSRRASPSTSTGSVCWRAPTGTATWISRRAGDSPSP